MASIEAYIMTVWQAIIAVVAIVLFIIAYIRYRNKKSEVALTLAIGMLYFAIAVIFSVTAEIMNLLEIIIGNDLWSSGEPMWVANWFLYLIQSFQVAYFFIVLGLFMFHRFALLLAPDDPKKKLKDRAGLIMAVALITFGIIKRQFPLPGLDELGATLYQIDIWVIVFGLFMDIPVIASSIHMYRRIQPKTVEQRRLRFMVMMGWMILVMLALFVIDAVFTTIGIPEASYWAKFAGHGCAMLSFIFAYLSFYAR